MSKTKYSNGYTLIEMIVVILIISIVTMIGFESLNLSSKRDSSRNTALDVRNAIRSAQEQAQTNKVALTGSNANTPADYYGLLLSCQGSGCGINSTTGKFVANTYKVIRIEKCQPFNCDPAHSGNATDCQATVVSSITLPSGITITTDKVASGGPDVNVANTTDLNIYPRFIAFTKGSSTPQFYGIDANNATATVPVSTLTLTIVGASPSPTVTIYANTGRIDSTNTF